MKNVPVHSNFPSLCTPTNDTNGPFCAELGHSSSNSRRVHMVLRPPSAPAKIINDPIHSSTPNSIKTKHTTFILFINSSTTFNICNEFSYHIKVARFNFFGLPDTSQSFLRIKEKECAQNKLLTFRLGRYLASLASFPSQSKI